MTLEFFSYDIYHLARNVKLTTENFLMDFFDQGIRERAIYDRFL